jgi:hypothetical protein
MSKRTPEDRASSCAFRFADGRQCRMPRSSHSKYCFHHARKLYYLADVEEILPTLTEAVRGGSTPASALAHILSCVCASVAQGRIAPKQANAIARDAGVLLKSISKSMEESR